MLTRSLGVPEPVLDVEPHNATFRAATSGVASAIPSAPKSAPNSITAASVSTGGTSTTRRWIRGAST
jgi:hypothetical protein